ncbi:hypothetical protein SKAU_G00331740 [Synaphobranchus kaupii]|uniref:Uncharacterized protein n=1 Tax=Synaphobranchus kaupii TaxID=118154 RepID=A0A9Q1ELB3_SYNKA|nr:hypothetical protein SKAU_G00331740 [Synaphobranchus kaupii]
MAVGVRGLTPDLSQLQEGQLVVRQFQFLRWSAYRDVPDSKKTFLSLMGHVNKWQRECGEGPNHRALPEWGRTQWDVLCLHDAAGDGSVPELCGRILRRPKTLRNSKPNMVESLVGHAHFLQSSRFITDARCAKNLQAEMGDFNLSLPVRHRTPGGARAQHRPWQRQLGYARTPSRYNCLRVIQSGDVGRAELAYFIIPKVCHLGLVLTLATKQPASCTSGTRAVESAGLFAPVSMALASSF